MELLPGEGLYAEAMAIGIAFPLVLVRPQPQAAANVPLLPAVRTRPWQIGFYTGINKFPLGDATWLQDLRTGGCGVSSSFCFGRLRSSCR